MAGTAVTPRPATRRWQPISTTASSSCRTSTTHRRRTLPPSSTTSTRPATQPAAPSCSATDSSWFGDSVCFVCHDCVHFSLFFFCWRVHCIVCSAIRRGQFLSALVGSVVS
uniref:Uncharacterized protein n=1 Tax=Aegilops tauschii subsp. strangulata TaxID=200361 RepID=A0A453E9H8_AEGTS